ncbi:hypothetical protein QBC35DRAFT_146850 [Podospora australis]|uniref:SPT2 chromatin protein n=1 Tax=Podospora australis TaxID=1536484 RepID=A0AAN6WIY7_9PEZI|nr:hypothetical protein QBC35DRAFT_146850 [Podospora australis]
MGIADILGAITGEAPGPSSNTAPSRPALLPPKRKAEEDLRSAASKTPRIESNADRLSRPNGNSPRPSPRPSDKPSVNTSTKSTLSSSSLSSASRPPIKPSSASASRPSTGASITRTNTSSNGDKPMPSRPALNGISSAPPKRSFAEIMARAKANSDMRESLGKISHKPLERNLTMKERKELKAEEGKKSKGAAKNGLSSRSSSASAPSRILGKNGTERGRVSPGASSASSKAKAKAQAAEEEKKKVKKAALATTGYTGTARPRPGASSAAKTGSSAHVDDRDRSYGRSKYGGPLSVPRRRRDDEDSELDDFIVDDEDEDDYGRPEPGYYSDDTDDMEAGLDEIDEEETAAERRARLEDQREQALELKLKREKEERKRRAMEAMRRRP